MAAAQYIGSLEINGRELVVNLAVDRAEAEKVGARTLKERDVTENTDPERKDEDGKRPVVQDARNLYLLREGLIMQGTPAYNQMSQRDRAKRYSLEMESKQKTKNPNFSISRSRLSVHNLPLATADAQLKALVRKLVQVRFFIS